MKTRAQQLSVWALLLSLLSQPASACAVVPRPGYEARIAGEEAVIIWDEANRVEHFIRRASFETSGPSLGFLVPTPSAPQLAEASDELFGELVRRIDCSKLFVFDSILWQIGLELFEASWPMAEFPSPCSGFGLVARGGQ